jgi:2-C-methyl-D-erythritol 4-phosphate cytidylyltransferase/2-C-methyl-D-erythritol 2,4-cyclodiphosphate synthase
MEVAGLIVAAGRGSRAGGAIPKQYQKVNRVTMLSLTIKAFLASQKIDCVKVVINKKDTFLYEESIDGIKDKRLLSPCFGGAERTNSVFAGLLDLKACSPRKVLIHDGARPFVSKKLINNVILELDAYQAVFPVIPVVDALWKIEHDGLGGFKVLPGPERENLCRAQTPQGFCYRNILESHSKNKKTKLDDIAVAYEHGFKIKTVIGDEKNLKVTSETDLKRFMQEK